MDEERGYDVNFVAEVSEDLKCIACHFALRNPVQLGECGHRFCKSCYEKMKMHSIQSALELCCPFDRISIDANQVFNDRAADRKVLGLQVSCTHTDQGCEWTSDLRNLQLHLEEDCDYAKVKWENEGCEVKIERKFRSQHVQPCTFKAVNQGITITGKQTMEMSMVLEQLSKRIDGLEVNLAEKDKKISLLRKEVEESKQLMDESKRELREKSDQINELRSRLTTSEQFLLDIRQLNPGMFAFEWKVDNYFHLSQLGVEVLSPQFYSSLNGYCCQLGLTWSGAKKGILEVMFYVCPGRNDAYLPKPFNMNVLVEFVGSNDTRFPMYIEPNKGARERCFTVYHLTSGASRNGIVCTQPLKMPKLGTYILNNSIYLVCHLLPCDVAIKFLRK